MLKRPGTRVGAVLVTLLLLAAAPWLGCGGSFVSEQGYRDLAAADPITSVAVVPLRLAGRLAVDDPAIERAAEKIVTPEGGNAAPPPHVVAELLVRHLAEAMSARGVRVVPASDVARIFGAEKPSAVVAARRLNAEFGVDAVLLGSVSRFTERSGEAIATLQPASVSFEVTLHTAPGGQALWTGRFDETQKPLNENILRAARYPGGGSRWLSAEELARWGVGEVVRAMPLAP